MKYRVTVAINCNFVLEADDVDEAEALAIGKIPISIEAEDIEIIDTVVVPEAH